MADLILRCTATWYTNPQTEALCELLGLENRINPVPPGFKEAQAAAQAAALEAAKEATAREDAEKQAALDEAKRAALAMIEKPNADEIAIDDDDDE